MSISVPQMDPSTDNTQSVGESTLRSSLSQSPSPISSTATTLVPNSDTRRRHTGHRSSLSISRTLERLRLAEPHRDNEAQVRIRQIQHDIAAASAQMPKRSTAGLFKALCSTDLLFLIDTTMSMKNYIDAAKEQVNSIVNDIEAAFLNEAEVRIAVVAYRDFLAVPNIQFLDFTPSVKSVRSFLEGLKVSSGNDVAEDVLGGLRQALEASWILQTRCMIHIADAPPHGRELHDLSDRHDLYLDPSTQPHGLTHGPLFKQMTDYNINYALLRVNSSTDRMAFTLFQEYAAVSAGCALHKDNRYYGEACAMSVDLRNRLQSTGSSQRSANAGLLFEEQELGTTYNKLRHLVLRSVTTSASRTVGTTLASSASTRKAWSDKKQDTKLGTIDEKEENADKTQLEITPPEWENLGWLDETLIVEGFSPDEAVHGTVTLDDMMVHDDNIKLKFVDLTIRKRSLHFAQGALRRVFYAQTTTSNDYFVVKSFRRAGKRLEHYAEDMRCQTLCQAFALEFNALSREEHSINFIVTMCLKGRSEIRSGDQCMSLEPFIKGNYVKYNNNHGYVNEDESNNPFNQAAQAFSHFTFERSQGRFLVCDLQGVGGILTDPAIHTSDPKRFKLPESNYGKEGFKFFFLTHACNSICAKLELKSNSAMLKSGKYEYRTNWPSMEVCCSNKLCGRLLHLASAKTVEELPRNHWCDECWTRLQSSRITLDCDSPYRLCHKFDVFRFFYESQGRSVPEKCPEHLKKEGAVSGTDVTITVMPWAWLKSAMKKNSNA